MVEGRQARRVLRLGRRSAEEQASLPVERAVRIAHNGDVVADLSTSPHELGDLAVGHLVLAGRLRRREDVRAVRQEKVRGGTLVRVSGTAHPAEAPAPPLPKGPALAPAEVLALMKGLQESAALYREGGGVHTSALATPQGEAIVAADIGKVNTIDRLAGRAFLGGHDPQGMVFLTTGRLTGAMVARALALGCPVLVSHSGPTTEGLALAEKARATLLGYARGGSFNVYCDARRVVRPSRRRKA